MDSSSIIHSILNYSQETDEDDYYKIIGCSPLANTNQIMAEYRIKAKLYHPDKILQNHSITSNEEQFTDNQLEFTNSQTPLNAQETAVDEGHYPSKTNRTLTRTPPDKITHFNETLSSKNEQFKRLVEAKEVLCDEGRRREFDAWRGAGLQLPFKTWKALFSSAHKAHSMHWTGVPKGPAMLTDNILSRKEERHYHPFMTSEELFKKFRNYEI